MAWQDRDYYRDPPDGTGGGFASRLHGASMVTCLLVINFAVFILDAILTGSARAGGFSPFYWGNFNLDQALHGLQLWRWVTYQFLHADFFHILFNLIGLFFFGPLMERWWGSRRFLAFYLLCGVSGAVVFTVLGSIPGLLPGGNRGLLVGASGSVFGILAACAMLFPKQRVMLLFPPIPMSMRTLALVFLGIAAFSLIVGARNAGGDAAHLGGAALGALLVKFPRVLDWADRLGLPRRRRESWQTRQIKQQERQVQEDAQVDRILAKVRDQGLQSLTRSEKKTLQRATERQRRGQ